MTNIKEFKSKREQSYGLVRKELMELQKIMIKKGALHAIASYVCDGKNGYLKVMPDILYDVHLLLAILTDGYQEIIDSLSLSPDNPDAA